MVEKQTQSKVHQQKVILTAFITQKIVLHGYILKTTENPKCKNTFLSLLDVFRSLTLMEKRKQISFFDSIKLVSKFYLV